MPAFKPLTTFTINNLPPGESIGDTGENQGLRVVCAKARGIKVFFYRYRSPETGYRAQVRIGPYYQAKAGQKQPEGTYTLAQARVRLAELKTLRASGVCVARQQRAEKVAAQRAAAEKAAAQAYTVTDLCEDYLTNCIDGRRTRKAAAEARRALYGDPVRSMGDRPAVDVSSQSVFELIKEILARGANVQAGFVLRELTRAFDNAIGELKLPQDAVNPCYQAKGRLRLKGEKLTNEKGRRYLTEGELAAFLKWLPGSRFTPGQQGVLHLTVLTGCRTGEACSLRCENLDLDASVWHQRENKTDTARNVQLSTQAVELLKQQHSTGYVFTNALGSPIQQKSLTETAWRLRKGGDMLAIDHWTPHDLRRTVRTGLAKLGCPDATAEAILGHVRGGIEGVYDLHKREPECREWLQRWCDHLDMLTRSDNVVPMGVKRG